MPLRPSGSSADAYGAASAGPGGPVPGAGWAGCPGSRADQVGSIDSFLTLPLKLPTHGGRVLLSAGAVPLVGLAEQAARSLLLRTPSLVVRHHHAPRGRTHILWSGLPDT